MNQPTDPKDLDESLATAAEEFLNVYGIENAIVVISNPDTSHVIFRSRGTLPMQLGLLELNKTLLQKEV